jgi:endonuclease YncB( thermonuclease family)
MQKTIGSVLLATAIFRSDPVLVTRVTDGDTITVASIGNVTLLGIEAAPTPRARERLEALVVRRWVRLETDDPKTAASLHRAYVMLETGEFVNATLVREGLARVAPRGRFARRPELERAQEEAQRFRRGLWARYTPVRP